MGNTFSPNRQNADNGYRLPHAIKQVAGLRTLGIARPRGHRTFALTIGINTYNSASFKSEELKGAVNDADEFEKYLCEDLGVPEENIIRLRNEEATRSAIIDGFRSLENNRKIVANMAAIIIYYAGHGAVAHKPVEWKDWETPGDEIEILCPSDMGLPDENNKIVDGIPDRTISQLLLDLSKAKGNNITLILDCCHAAGINRGGPRTIDGEAGQVELRPRNIQSVQNLSPNCDAGLYLREPGHSGSLWDSHVLLAACRRSQTAWEKNGSGIFTEALLKGMRCEPLVGVLTYASLMRRLELPEDMIQTPHLDGKYIHRRLFDSSPLDSSMILCHREEDRLVLDAGSLQGITVDSTFAIHGADLSDPVPHQIATAVVKKVENFVSYLQPLDVAFFTTYGDHRFPWYARLTRASGPVLAIHCNSPDDLTRILTKDCETGLTVPAIATDNRCEADLCLTVEGSTVFFDRGDKDSVFGASKDFPSRFSAGLDVNNITGIRRVVDRYGRFNSHLNAPGSLPFSDYISMKMHELKIDKGGLSPTGDNILPDGEEKPIEFVIDSSLGEKYYGFTIHNTSNIDLYAYLFYFDASTLEIDAWYCPPNLGSNKKEGLVDTYLQRGSTLTLGFGSGGMSPIRFTVPDGQDVDVSFFKIFVTTQAVNLRSISQSPPFNEAIKRAAERAPPPVPKDWASRTIPVVSRRAQIVQSLSVQPGVSSEPAED
ncbi:hypothetical protein ARMSODRAFT_1080291 [Armillaria solidipes]|uniref:Peptidase C14 caspase domain-containing protein n=1 Tax=Armillaria solidipes TaxID=1076256 RepID=A0A2H3CLK7_9AGAR|nr:hypothetical protein ARMSODRAFT_1080291 [Armillaria solidipes]